MSPDKIDYRIREIEKEIDQFYLDHEFFRLSHGVACQYILMVYEYENLFAMLSGKISDRYSYQATVHDTKYAITHAINWLSNKVNINNDLVEKIHGKLFDKAIDFSNLASNYHSAISGYTMENRNLAKASLIDETTVRFEYSEEESRYDVLDLKISRNRSEDYIKTHFEDNGPELLEARNAVFRSVSIDAGHRVIYSTEKIDWNAMMKYAETMLTDHTLPPSCWNFCGFTVKDFKLFWSALLLLSMFNSLACIYAIENCNTSPRSITSTIMVRRKNNWAKHIAKHSGLEKEDVLKILEYHTYSPSHEKRDIVLTPFIYVTKEHMALAPNLIITNNLGRNLLKHLSRNYKDEYDRSSNIFADQMISEFERALEGKYFHIISNKKIPGHPELPDIDICLTDEKRGDTIFCEFKWTIPSADPSEVAGVMDIQKKALRQIKLIKDFCFKYPKQIEKLLGVQRLILENTYFVIVLKNTAGTYMMFDRDFPTIEYSIFCELLDKKRSLNEVMLNIEERTYLPKKDIDFKSVDIERVIGRYKIIWTGWQPL
jgi:hypothetical protein